MSNCISSSSLHDLLRIPLDTPLGIDEMCGQLKPVLYPAPALSVRLEQFCNALVNTMQSLGTPVRSGDEALMADGRFAAGTVILAPGNFPDDLLAINRVTTLYNNMIVGIYDEPAPLTQSSSPQQRLDAIVERLAHDMVHILIFVTDDSWTICTMNGGVVSFLTPLPSREDVRNTLVPKLTAQVVPPRAEDLDIMAGALEIETPEFAAVAADFAQCSALWSNNVALLTHTSTAGLNYRNGFYQRIVARYLDQRSGMSYGFFARQRPVVVEPALLADGDGLLPVRFRGNTLFIPVPEVSLFTTRSGCRKNQLDPKKDLVEIGITLHEGKGRAWLKTPSGTLPEAAAKPSFDTLTILAHALGNAVIASIFLALKPEASFPRHLATFGASMSHWHDYPKVAQLPEGYYLHGESNPPVACSTPQSAAYSLLGKIAALEAAFEQGAEYRGDVHVEPNHGTNIVGILSLAETAKLLNTSSLPLFVAEEQL